MNEAARTGSDAKRVTHDFVLTDTAQGIEIANWQLDHTMLGIEPFFKVSKTTLHGGRQEGSTLITIDTGTLQQVVIPTRGMGLYRAQSEDVALAWNSPVDEVVHPALSILRSAAVSAGSMVSTKCWRAAVSSGAVTRASKTAAC